MREEVLEHIDTRHAGTADYLILMGMVHPFLTALFGVVNPIIYQQTQEMAATGHSNLLALAAVIALLANFGMQMYAYNDKGLTANMTTMIVKETFNTENTFWPMVAGYVTNTAMQTLGTPSNYMNVINMIASGETSMIAGLSAQYISGMVSTGAATALIYTGTLEPVAKTFNNWRMKGKEYFGDRVNKALTFLGEHRDVLSKYD